MTQHEFEIIENMQLNDSVYLMRFKGDSSDIKKPGQFVEIALDRGYLRRPFSIFDKTDDGFAVAYKIVGSGTERMAELNCGQKLDVLSGLGNGFDLEKAGERPLVIGGGIGIAAVYWLCKQLADKGTKPLVILGYNSAKEDCFSQFFLPFAKETVITTADGSKGMKGFVTDALSQIKDASFSYACGPLPMLKAVDSVVKQGQISMEARMGCGFGACMGCTIATTNGNKRVCKEGPVFQKGEICW